MSDINVYPEMNRAIKDIYSKSNEFEQQYVLTWIEQLESENERLREVLKEIRELETSRLGDDVLRSDVGWMADEALRGDTE